MKHTNKKGFTIVELVIVIAVIAILAAVLIPNLSRLVEKANESKAMQEAKAAYDNYLIDDTKDSDGKTNAEKIDTDKLCIKSGKYFFHVEKGQLTDVTESHTGTNVDSGFKVLEVKDGALEGTTTAAPVSPTQDAGE